MYKKLCLLLLLSTFVLTAAVKDNTKKKIRQLNNIISEIADDDLINGTLDDAVDFILNEWKDNNSKAIRY